MLTFSPRTKTSNVSEIMQHSVSVPSSCIETSPDATNGNCTSSHSFCMALHFLDVFVSAFAASSATRIRMASSFSATTTNGLPGNTPRLLTASARAPAPLLYCITFDFGGLSSRLLSADFHWRLMSAASCNGKAGLGWPSVRTVAWD